MPREAIVRAVAESRKAVPKLLGKSSASKGNFVFFFKTLGPIFICFYLGAKRLSFVKLIDPLA